MQMVFGKILHAIWNSQKRENETKTSLLFCKAKTEFSSVDCSLSLSRVHLVAEKNRVYKKRECQQQSIMHEMQFNKR